MDLKSSTVQSIKYPSTQYTQTVKFGTWAVFIQRKEFMTTEAHHMKGLLKKILYIQTCGSRQGGDPVETPQNWVFSQSPDRV